MVKGTDAGDGVSVKNREEGNGEPPTAFPKNMASQIRNKTLKSGEYGSQEPA